MTSKGTQYPLSGFAKHAAGRYLEPLHTLDMEHVLAMRQRRGDCWEKGSHTSLFLLVATVPAFAWHAS